MNTQSHDRSNDQMSDTTYKREGPKSQDFPSICLAENDNTALAGAELLDRVAEAIGKYVVLHDNPVEIPTLWTAFTHGFPTAWEHSPRLLVTAAGPESGKSRLMKVLNQLVGGADFLEYATGAYLRRAPQDRGLKGRPYTLLLDEADTFLASADGREFRPVLNAGFEKGAMAGLVGKDGEQQNRAEHIQMFNAVAMAGIGDGWMWPALISRSFVIKLKPALSRERPADLTPSAKKELATLGRCLGEWVWSVLPDLSEAWPDMPPELNNRARDKWRPLIAIADAAGGHWPETARAIAIAESKGAIRPLGQSEKLLGAIRDVFYQTRADRLFSEDIVRELLKRFPAMTNSRLSAQLKPFGIAPQNIRIGTQGPKKGYQRSAFEDAWSRYLPPLDVADVAA